MKSRLLIAFLLSGLSVCCANRSHGETLRYKMLSIEGKVVIVSIKNDWEHHQVRISCGRNSVTAFDNKYGAVKGHLVNKKFLELEYSRSGGSNIQANDVLIICVKDTMPLVALCMFGNCQFQSGEILVDYDVDVRFLKDSALQPSLKISTNFLDQDGKKKVHSRHTCMLKFDSTRCLFYNTLSYLHQRFHMCNERNNQNTWKKLDGHYPSFAIGPDYYYFIDGAWYRNTIGPIYKEKHSILYQSVAARKSPN